MSNSLNRKNKLKSQTQIQELFEKKRTIRQGNFILFFDIKKAEDFSFEISFSSSKKKLRRAVDRNRMKRLMREAFRTNSDLITKELPNPPVKLALMLICLSEKLMNSEETHEKIKLILKRLNYKIKTETE